MKTPFLSAAMCAMWLVVGSHAVAEEPKKIIFISGKPSHGPMAHQHRAGNLFLAERLKEANLNVNPIVLPEDGYPADHPSVLEDAATVVVFCTGHRGHLLNPRWKPNFDALPDHPIANGVASAAPNEEEIKAKLDDKSERKKPATPASKEPVPPAKLEDRAAAAVDFQKLRQQLVRKIDSQKSLALLSRTLATTEDPRIQTALLRGMLNGLEGRRNVAAPADWKNASAKVEEGSDGQVKQLAQRLSQIFGDKGATEKAFATVRDGAAPLEERRNALKSLVTQKSPELKTTLEKLLDDSALRVDAIRAFSVIEDPKAPELLLKRYAGWDESAQRTVIETLATRKGYATSLLAAIKDERVPKADVPAYIARSLAALLGDAFTHVYGDLKELSKDKAELIAKYQKLLTSEKLAKADAGKGRAIFQMSCFACHVLYGEGGVIGPDLTGSNRADLNYILLNMIDPSADIPDAYKLNTIKTKGGQVLTGTLAEEDDQRIVLNMIGQKMTVVKSDIASRDVAPVSMMPEGLLPTLNDTQVLDLVKYLQTTGQVDLPQ